MSHYQHLLDQLKQLRLGGLLDTLEVRLKEAEKRQLAYVDFLTLLIQDELERRSQTKFARRLKKACFAEIKTLEEFDFGFNPNIKRRRIYDLATCRFLENKENICLCGPVGVGKSHIALALGHEAVRRGHDVRYIQAPRLFHTLEAARADLPRSPRPALVRVRFFDHRRFWAQAPDRGAGRRSKATTATTSFTSAIRKAR